MQNGAVRPDLDVVPLLEQTAAGYLRAARRTHLDPQIAFAALVETIDDGTPIPSLTHCRSQFFWLLMNLVCQEAGT